MSRPLIPSNVDLASEANVLQCRHEFNRATDFGGEAELAAWARKWGVSALDRAEHPQAGGWEDFGPSNSLVRAAEDAQDVVDSLRVILTADAPDVASIRARFASLRQLVATINTKLEPSE